ncbi:hypothetical protein GYA93_22565 [Gordonia desulfuricans]|uniref:Uncharacterized protein n=1 Tax=Gordonia desulfuricans TaxID=89051 RepID=A0A7K3LVS1_9ACTN|nr:hypothetical protein [Gordonia desulfuricans]NDK92319.1 hypothetical protein [Gordonia desulfuricans]
MTAETATTPTGRSATSGAGPLRVAGPDESFLLAEQRLGFRTPVQYLWVLDDDPGADAVEKFAHVIAGGQLNRAVARRRVPGARGRWVRSSIPPQVLHLGRIDDDAVGPWADGILRTADLHAPEGLAWKLCTVTTTRGRRVVALLISHLVADGEAIMRALIAAADGHLDPLPDPAVARGRRAVREDVTDAATQLRAAARSLKPIMREIRSKRPAKSEATPAVPRPPVTYDPLRVALATVDLDAADFHELARRYHGTVNTLFTAIVAGIARRAGHPDSEELRVSVAVSKRGGPEDRRANASGGIWLRLRDGEDAPFDLGGIRTQSREAFTTYAESGNDVPDETLSVVRLLPRKVLGALLPLVPAPDVSVSNLGVLNEKVQTICGVRASSFVLRLMVQEPVGGARADMPGPGMSGWIVQYDDRITLSFAAFATERFGDDEGLRALVDAELAAWDLEHRFW